MKRQPTFFDPMRIGNCAVEGERGDVSRSLVGSVVHNIHVAYVTTMVDDIVRQSKPSFRANKYQTKIKDCFLGVGSVLDMSGSLVELGKLGSLQDDYHKIGGDFRRIGDDIRHVLKNEKRKSA